MNGSAVAFFRRMKQWERYNRNQFLDETGGCRLFCESVKHVLYFITFPYLMSNAVYNSIKRTCKWVGVQGQRMWIQSTKFMNDCHIWGTGTILLSFISIDLSTIVHFVEFFEWARSILSIWTFPFVKTMSCFSKGVGLYHGSQWNWSESFLFRT